MRQLIFGGAFAACAIALLGGCSTVMEAERPSAVNLDRFAPGQKRVDVVAQIGTPQGQVKDGELGCDVYKLYTKGTSKAAKGGIIVTEAAADVFTLGLAEAVLTPAQGLTKSHLHTVMFCYNGEERLASIRDQGLPRNLAK